MSAACCHAFKSTIVLAAVATCIGIAIVLVMHFVPGNLQYFQHVKSFVLQTQAKDWELRSRPTDYSYSNTTDSVYLFSTNVVVDGVTVKSIMRLDSSFFKGRGYLLLVEPDQVVWIDLDGKVIPLAHRVTEDSTRHEGEVKSAVPPGKTDKWNE